jgi:hypothetical protein
MSSNKICEKCVEDKSKEFKISENLDTNVCSETYSNVKNCMDDNKGSISSCKNEWEKFRFCFTNEKNRKKITT